MDWHSRSAEAVCESVETAPTGMTAEEAAERRDTVGPNEITGDHGSGPLEIFIAQFSSALIWVLIVAAALSVAIGHLVDAVLIAIILLANGLFGFAQEYRAERSLDALREMAAPEVRVRRDGEEATVPATELVPGDIVLLTQGDVVPADARLFEAQNLEVDEAALTGESVPVSKSTEAVDTETPLAERSSMVYKGTNVTRGDAVAVVVETGMDTEMGEIATAIAGAESRQTPLQRDLDRLARRLGVGVVALSAVIVPLLVFQGRGIVQAGLTAVSLAVAAIPEGLPAVVTLTLALGVRQMADENALVRTLPAVEALGSVDVVCTDKTGTLTEGEMQLTDVVALPQADGGELVAGHEVDESFVLEVAASAERGSEHPLAKAIVEGARERGIDPEEPDSFENVPGHGVRATTSDGEVLVGNRKLLEDEGVDPSPADDAMERLESEGKTAMLVSLDGDLIGVLADADTVKESAKQAVSDLRARGVDVWMLTGDNERTARAVAEQVGIDPENVMAEVLPDEKADAVEEIQDDGSRAMMVGDGVNDAPALAAAYVGTAIGSGTDVAIEAADVTLMRDDPADVLKSIRISEATLQKIKQNLFWALGYNTVMIPLASLGLLQPVLAAAAMAASSVSVLTNSLLFRGYEPDEDYSLLGL